MIVRSLLAGRNFLIAGLSSKTGPTIRRSLADMSSQKPSVAVVLSGCGVYDGAEIFESTAVIETLSREDAECHIYAPDKPQMHVIDHTKGAEMKETRNVLIESARIARGKIKSLAELQEANHHAVIFPGGFGAAKNLCDFAVKQADCTVDDDVRRVLEGFHKSGKPIGLCCIAPVLAAKLVKGSEVTVGVDQEGSARWPYAGTGQAIESMGAKHVPKDVHEIHVDATNKIVTTPAFMCETRVHEIHDGVAEMVKGVLKLI